MSKKNATPVPGAENGAPMPPKKKKKKGSGLLGRIIRRFFLVVFTVILLAGKRIPLVLAAARTRSLASLTAASGRPTISKAGSPLEI